MKHTIERLCSRVPLYGKYKEEVLDFKRIWGEEATLDILQNILKVVDHNRESRRQISVVGLWKAAADKHVDGVAGRTKAKEREEEQEAEMKAYFKSKDAGFDPTRANIKKLLDDMLDEGDVSQADYNIAIDFGLDYLFDALSIKEPKEKYEINF